MHWFKLPPKIYFKRGALDLALRILKGKKRAFIITDSFLFNSGAVDKVTKILKEIDIEYQIFFDINTNTTFSEIEQSMSMLRPFEPDIIIALGGGTSIDAAKIMWLLYEQPEIDIKKVLIKNADISRRISEIPALGNKARFVAIPTTSGTGSEVTPFSVITDDKNHSKYTIADYALTPNISIIDPNFADNMPKNLTAITGIDALVRAIEAYVSPMSTNFTNSSALEAAKLVFRYLERAYNDGANDPVAREKMHYASAIAGMSFANSFLGIAHSMALNLGAVFGIPYGAANSLLIRQVIKYNASLSEDTYNLDTDDKIYTAKIKYVQIADELGLKGETAEEKINNLISAIEGLMIAVGLPLSIKDIGIDKKSFNANLDMLVEFANADRCTAANKVGLTLDEIKKIYVDAYNGKV